MKTLLVKTTPQQVLDPCRNRTGIIFQVFDGGMSFAGGAYGQVMVNPDVDPTPPSTAAQQVGFLVAPFSGGLVITGELAKHRFHAASSRDTFIFLSIVELFDDPPQEKPPEQGVTS